MSDNTPFSQQIAFLAKGEINDHLTDEMTELVKAINDFGAAGDITLKLKLKPTIGSTGEVMSISISADISSKRPGPSHAATHMYPAADGDLLRIDPDQGELELTGIDTARIERDKDKPH